MHATSHPIGQSTRDLGGLSFIGTGHTLSVVRHNCVKRVTGVDTDPRGRFNTPFYTWGLYYCLMMMFILVFFWICFDFVVYYSTVRLCCNKKYFGMNELFEYLSTTGRIMIKESMFRESVRQKLFELFFSDCITQAVDWYRSIFNCEISQDKPSTIIHYHS